MARASNRLVQFILLTAVILVAWVPGPAGAQPNPTNVIHMRAKPAVVRIYAGYIGDFINKKGQTDRVQLVGSGSGFIINPAGYILTNAHVVSDVKDGDEEAKKKLINRVILKLLHDNNLPVTDQNINKAINFLNSDGYRLTNLRRINFVFLQSGKRYPFEIKAYGAPVGEGKDLESGKDVSVLKIEIRNAPTLRLGVSEKVAVGDHVWVMGFPGAADSDQLDAESELEPTTNDGSISARKATRDGTPVLQTNTNTTHGNSGGPVLNANGEAIGLLTFRGNTVNGQEVQGFNFIVPIDTANEFVRQAGTDNKPGAVDEKWTTGLDHYWKKEYSAAQKDFGEISALFPDHREAKRLVTECQEHIARGEDETGKAAAATGVALVAILLMGGGFVLVIAIVVVIVLMMRKKPARQAHHAHAHAHAPAHAPPHHAGSGYPAYGHPPGPSAGAPAVAHPYGGAPMGMAAAPSPGMHAGGMMPAPMPPMGGGKRGAKTEMFQGAPEANIRWVIGPLMGQVTPVSRGVVIGREGAEVIVPDPQVSGTHAWIGLKGSALVFVDRGSTNGSLVNDAQVMAGQEIVLKHGDVVALGKRGNIKFMVQLN